MIDKNPLFAAGPKGFLHLGQIIAGQPQESPCVDHGSDLAGKLGMDINWTRNDGVFDSGAVDMGFHYGDFPFPSLHADAFLIPASTGGGVEYFLLAGGSYANRLYVLLGGIRCSWSGTVLPGNLTTLPLNWDMGTNHIVWNPNDPAFSNFMGTLDGAGQGSAKMNP